MNLDDRYVMGWMLVLAAMAGVAILNALGCVELQPWKNEVRQAL
jgi:hypothetical protein